MKNPPYPRAWNDGALADYYYADEAAAYIDHLKEQNAQLVEALKLAEEGLRLSYQVCDYPANGCSIQDDALALVRSALAKASDTNNDSGSGEG